MGRRLRPGDDDAPRAHPPTTGTRCASSRWSSGPRTWSLAAALHPEVSAALDRAQDKAAIEVVGWVAAHATTRVGPRGRQVQVPVESIEVTSVLASTRILAVFSQNLHRIQLCEALYCSATLADVLASTPSACPTSAQLCPAARASRIASPMAFSTATDARQHSRTLASGSADFPTRSRRWSPEPLSRRVALLVPIISSLHPPAVHHLPSCPRAAQAAPATADGLGNDVPRSARSTRVERRVTSGGQPHGELPADHLDRVWQDTGPTGNGLAAACRRAR